MQQANKKPEPFIHTIFPQSRRKTPIKSGKQAYEIYSAEKEEDDKLDRSRGRGHHFVGET